MAETLDMASYAMGQANGTKIVPDEKIIEATDAWLDEHIDPTTGYAVDTSLQVSGAAADSKTVGDELDDLKSAVEVLQPAATALDEGKALIVKTVENGKVAEWQLGEETGGLTATAANLLLAILNEGVYGSDQTENIELLTKALTNIAPVSISAELVSTPLVGLHYSDLEFNVIATFDDASTLVVSNYRILTTGSVTSGSNTVTVAFRGVSTNVTFTASTVTTYSITQTLTGATSSNKAYVIATGERFATEITPEANHYITAYSVTMGGVDITSTAYNNGNIVIDEVTDDVVITVTASAYTYMDPLIQKRPYTTEGDSNTTFFVDEFVTSANPSQIAYYHVGRVSEYPAKADCTLYWTITNTSDSAISLEYVGLGMVKGSDAANKSNGIRVAYWSHIDNSGHSLAPGASLSGEYQLKAGWQLILTTTVQNNEAISESIRGDYTPETFDDYTLLYTITSNGSSYPQIGGYAAKTFYSDDGSISICTETGFLRKIAENVGPADYDVVVRVKFDPEISTTTGYLSSKAAIGYIETANDNNIYYSALTNPISGRNAFNEWTSGSLKATASGMILVTNQNGIPNGPAVSIEIYGKEITE